MKKRSPKIALCQIPSISQLMDRLWTRTSGRSKQHPVYMSFVRNSGRWHCRFHQDDLPKTPISKQFVFCSTEKIYESARRGNGLINMESRRALDVAVTIGRGGIWLRLTDDQYSALVMRKPFNPAQN